MTATTHAWTCAFCGRSVPGRVDECYCGRKRPADRPPQAVQRANSRIWIGGLAVALVAGGGVWYFLNRAPAEPPVARPASDAAQSLPLASSNDPAVAAPVSDEIVKTSLGALVQVDSANGRGTGFFSSADVVTTSRGIVGNAKSASVTLPDGRQIEATLIASADQYRLVQLRVASSSPAWLPASPMRETYGAESLAKLTWPQTVARGTVKGLRREQGVESFGTDLPVHSDDDGAPLVDHTGRVVAVVSGSRTVSFDSARAYFRALAP